MKHRIRIAEHSSSILISILTVGSIFCIGTGIHYNNPLLSIMGLLLTWAITLVE